LCLAVAFGPQLGYLLHTAGGKDSRRPPD